MPEFPVCNITPPQAKQARDWIETNLQACTNNGANPGKSVVIEIIVDQIVLRGQDAGRGGMLNTQINIRRTVFNSYGAWNNLSEQEQINKIQKTIADVVNKARTNPPYSGLDNKGNAKTVPVFIKLMCGRDSVTSPTTGVGNP